MVENGAEIDKAYHLARTTEIDRYRVKEIRLSDGVLAAAAYAEGFAAARVAITARISKAFPALPP